MLADSRHPWRCARVEYRRLVRALRLKKFEFEAADDLRRRIKWGICRGKIFVAYASAWYKIGI